MSFHNIQESKSEDGSYLPTTIIVIMLYALQRFFLFFYLQKLISEGSQIAINLFGVLFGPPPHGFLGVLLGFDFIFSGGLFGPSIIGLFSFETLFVSIIQAIHFAINWFVVWIIFKVVRRI